MAEDMSGVEQSDEDPRLLSIKKQREDPIWDAWWGPIFDSLPQPVKDRLSIFAWREVGKQYGKAIRQAEAVAVAREREACAKLADESEQTHPLASARQEAFHIAAAIRARSEP